MSVVDRVVGVGAKSNHVKEEPTELRRAVSAGRIRPQSGNLGSKSSANLTASQKPVDVNRRLEEMYSNNVIGQLDNIMEPKT